MGGGEVFVCRLDDNDSNFYLDGSPADLTGQEGDVMVVFLEFWYKWYKVDDNKFLYHFADHNIDGTYIHVPQSLVGAYKGYVSSNRLYSWSDVTPTTNVSLSDFRSYAKARGTGFQVIDFQQHCVIAMMLYAKYKTRNLQGVLGPGGAGSSPATTTGSSNATGGADTKNESSKYVCGLGLEGVFGGICEWVEGVEINNRVWKITDPDGSTRNVNAETFSGWIINIAAENGPFFDVVPTQVGGSDSTHYSDYYSRTSDSSLVLARSGYRSYPTGGVAMNTTEFSSKVFDSLTPDWLDGRKIKALMPFCIMPSGKVRFSLYECVEDSADCCEVSKRFGGGGHAGAAGFVIDVSSDQFKDFLENHKLTSIR